MLDDILFIRMGFYDLYPLQKAPINIGGIPRRGKVIIYSNLNH